MSTCQRVSDDTYNVVIIFPKSLGTRCGESLNYCLGHCACFLCTFMVLSVAFLVYGLVWVLAYCHQEPGMALEVMSINDMLLYQNTTVPPPESPWQVNSGFNVDLSTWNPNTVAGCFTTFRRIVVRVEYRGQVILRQEVPLGFGLKPRSPNHAVSMKLKGGGFQLKNPDLGPFMQKELRSDNFSLDFYFDARYLRNDRKAVWLNFGCHVVAKTPSSNSTQAGANSVLTKDCVDWD